MPVLTRRPFGRCGGCSQLAPMTVTSRPSIFRMMLHFTRDAEDKVVGCPWSSDLVEVGKPVWKETTW